MAFLSAGHDGDFRAGSPGIGCVVNYFQTFDLFPWDQMVTHGETDGFPVEKNIIHGTCFAACKKQNGQKQQREVLHRFL